MKRFQNLIAFVALVITLTPIRVSAQAAKDPVLRDETVDSIGDGVVADVLNGVEAVAKDSEQAVVAEARRDVASVKSLVVQKSTPTPAADSDQAIQHDIAKLESLSQE
jgi:hypothetical protein